MLKGLRQHQRQQQQLLLVRTATATLIISFLLLNCSTRRFIVTHTIAAFRQRCVSQPIDYSIVSFATAVAGRVIRRPRAHRIPLMNTEYAMECSSRCVLL